MQMLFCLWHSRYVSRFMALVVHSTSGIAWAAVVRQGNEMASNFVSEDDNFLEWLPFPFFSAGNSRKLVSIGLSRERLSGRAVRFTKCGHRASQ